MTPFEQLAVGYFALLLAASAWQPSRRAVFYALGAIALVIVARLLPLPIRAWLLPHAYLVLGYWIPAALVQESHPSFEAWLARADARLPRVPAVSGLASVVLELAYLMCYPLVPAALVAVLVFGSAEDVTFFWVSTLASGYVCYVSLPWAAARPPRVLAAEPASAGTAGVAAVNVALLGRVSHRFVTFPSGHVAVSLAAACAVWRVWPAGGAAFGAVAALIAVAAVAGRYHYAIDVVLGLLAGTLVPVLTVFFV